MTAADQVLSEYRRQEELRAALAKAFDPHQPRDDRGRWTLLGALARAVTDAIGVDPYDVDVGELDAHCRLHERSPRSRAAVGSPCARSRAVDFAVHAWLPSVLRERFPGLADRLNATSPRWGHRNHPHVNPVRTEPQNP